MKVLSGHTSPETAYLVSDYPYGFRLRCKIRFWLEYKKQHGYRLVSQTTNPKKPGEVWNKPKASTYSPIGAMFLDEQGHVQWNGIGLWADVEKMKTFKKTFSEGLTEEGKTLLDRYIERRKDLSEL